MAKKIETYIKLQVPAGEAKPSPPVGPALGQHGVNIMEFCKTFNADTQEMETGLPVPVVITVYTDKSFSYVRACCIHVAYCVADSVRDLKDVQTASQTRCVT